MPKTIETINQNEEILLLDYILHSHEVFCVSSRRLRNYTMTLLMLDAGLRVGEVVQLRVSQLWFQGEPVHSLIVEPDQAKYDSAREIPLTVRTRTALPLIYSSNWRNIDPDLTFYAFYSGNCTKHITVRAIQKMIENASICSIGRKISPHALRHTFATKLMRKCSMRVVQHLLGHKNIASTQIYTHPNSCDLKEAIDSL